MAHGQLKDAMGRLRRAAGLPATQGPADAQLLGRYVAGRDQDAFATLVARYGRLVRSVCRHVLHHEQDIDDAFQATFLVLAARAGSIRKNTSVASWLYGVAYRTAMNARRSRMRRREQQGELAGRSREQPVTEAALREVQAILDDAVNRLPEKYRTPFILCCLEGRGKAEVARELGWREGTLSSRLARARKELQERLSRRGIALSAALCAVELSRHTATAAPSLVRATAAAGLAFADGQAAAGVVSAEAAALARAALPGVKRRVATALLLALGLATAATGTLYHPGTARPPADAPQEARPTPAAPRTDAAGDPLPEGAVRRIGTVRFRHGGGHINRLLLSPDEKTLVSKSYYGSPKVCVWEMPTGKLRYELPGHHEENRAAALSPDGKTLVTGQDAVIYFWDVATGRELRRLKCPQGGTEGLAFSPDGKTLASGHVGHWVLLWDVQAGTVLAQLPARHNRVGLLAFTPDGKTLATGDTLHNTIRLFDVAARKERLQLTRPSFVHDLAFSPDGATLAAGGQDGTVPLWDVAAGKLVREIRSPYKHVRGLAWAPDGRTLAASDFDEKGEHVYIRLWDPRTGQERRHVQAYGGLMESLTFTADGKTLLTGDGSSVIRLWDPATGQQRLPAAGLESSVWRMALSPDGRTLAFGDRHTRLWDVAAGRETETIPEFHWSTAFSPDSKTLACGSEAHAIHLWAVADRRLVRTLTIDWKALGLKWLAFRSVAWAPDGKSLASYADGYRTGARRRDTFIHIWDPANGKEMRQLEYREDEEGLFTIEAVAWAPDGRTLAASGRAEPRAGKVRFWDVTTGKELAALEAAVNATLPQLTGPQFPQVDIVSPRVVFSPDGLLLTMNTGAKSVFVWEAATGQLRCRLDGHDGGTACVTFAPDGRTLASAGYDRSIRLWDVASGKELKRLSGHRGKTNALAFAPDGKTLYSAGDDTTVLFWDVVAVTGRARPVKHLAQDDWDAAWDELASADAAKAGAAIARLAADPRTPAALKGRLRPAVAASAQDVARLLRDLDDRAFAVREKATRQLAELGESARPAIEQALARPPASLELRRRLERLREQLAVPSAEGLRMVRAVEVLDHVGTAEATQLLATLAKGAPDARLTREAKAAWERRQRRAAAGR